MGDCGGTSSDGGSAPDPMAEPACPRALTIPAVATVSHAPLPSALLQHACGDQSVLSEVIFDDAWARRPTALRGIGGRAHVRTSMSDKEIITLIWALVGAVAALAAARLDWPTSLMFFGLGIGALIMAVR